MVFTSDEIKTYRVKEGLSQRDVARYCNLSHELIGMMERGERKINEANFREFIKGIDGANQAKVRGTFETDLLREREIKKQKDKISETKTKTIKKNNTN